jgi:hypothetical protein
MKCDFSYHHYRAMLKEALKRGFFISSFRDFSEIAQKDKKIILRHDIDSFPERALTIAKIENDLKIKSTYFVRVNGDNYHPLDANSFLIFETFKKMGHEIGLHFTARALAPTLKMEMVKLFLIEKKCLEIIFDIKVESAAEHGDLIREKNFWQHHFFTQVSKKKVKIKHYPQEERYNSPKMHYLSDSLGQWREGCFCQNIAQYNNFQLLTHPALWGKGGLEAVSKLINLNLKNKEQVKKYQRVFDGKRRTIG